MSKQVGFVLGLIFMLLGLVFVGASAFDAVDMLGKLLSAGSMLGAIGALIEARKGRMEAEARDRLMSERVKLTIMLLQQEAIPFTLPLTVRRGDLTRAELFGVIGACYGPERFDSASLVMPLLMDGSLAAAQSGERSELFMNISDTEIFEKFKSNAELLKQD